MSKPTAEYPQSPQSITAEQREKQNLASPTHPNNSKESVMHTCPKCRFEGMTITEKRASAGSWNLCVCMFCFGLVPCSFLPFCVTACKDTYHRCPECQAEVGFAPVLGRPGA